MFWWTFATDAPPSKARPGRPPARAGTRSGRFVAYEYPRSHNDDKIGRLARQAHRRSRRTARAGLAAAQKLANAVARSGSSLAAADLDDIDLAPPPRRSANWDAW